MTTRADNEKSITKHEIGLDYLPANTRTEIEKKKDILIRRRLMMVKSEFIKIIIQWMGLIIYGLTMFKLFPNKTVSFYILCGIPYGLFIINDNQLIKGILY